MPNFLDPAFDDTTIVTNRQVGDPGVPEDSNLQGQSLKDLKAKTGTGVNAPTAGTVLKGTGAGTSEWVPENELFSDPIDGYGWIVNPLTHKPEWMSLSAGAGENNTLASVGTAGVSAVEPKTGTTLNIDGFNSPTGSISITKNAETKTLDFELSTADMPVIPIAKGGTGASTAAGIRAAAELDNVSNDAQVILQPGTPGVQQTGNVNVSGTVKAGTVDTPNLKVGATSGVVRLNSGVATTSTTTDNLPEGTGNLYSTNPRIDARITLQKGNANGLATLDGSGKVPTDQLPAIAISDTYPVANETEQLALTAEKGDIAVRSDENKSYVHNGGTAADMTDWTLLRTPTDAVLSVNNKTGAVSLASTDLSDTADILLKDAVQAVTNKTINGANNTLTVRLGNDVSGQLPVANGGIGLSTIPANSLLYASALDTVSALASGNDGDFLRSVSGVPTFQPVSIPKVTFEKVVDAAGNGDYTTISSALAAGYGCLLVKRGTYNETTALSTYTLSGKAVFIQGEDRKNTVINLAADAAGFFDLKYAGSVLSNITVRIPQTSLTDGWLKVNNTDILFDNVDFIGRGNSYTGSVIYINGAARFTMQYCTMTGNYPQGGYIKSNSSCDDNRFLYNYIKDTYTAGSYYCVNLSTTCNRLRFVGNYVENACYGPAVYLTCLYGEVTHNYIYRGTPATSNMVYGLYVGGSYANVSFNTFYSYDNGNGSMLTVSGANSSVIGNRINKGFYSATGGTTAYISGAGSSVIGNIVVSGVAETGTGIYISGANSVVTGNYVSGFSGTGGSGILVYGTGTNTSTLSGNTIVNCSQKYNDSTAAGIILDHPISFLPVTANSASTALTMKVANGFRIAISSDTTFSFTDEADMSKKPSQRYVLHIVQDATGGRTYTWPANVVWPGGTAPTASGANKTDRIYLDYSKADQKYYGSYELNY